MSIAEEKGVIPKAPFAMSDDLRLIPFRSATSYLKGDSIIDPVGAGIDGSVYLTSRDSAVKVHSRKPSFLKELSAYKRLLANQAYSVCGHRIPRLIAYDEQYLIIEMSTVKPPYLLDFASVDLDFSPPFPKDIVRDWHRELKVNFGTNWIKVLQIYDALIEHHGIYHKDLSPRNCAFLVPGEDIHFDEDGLDAGWDVDGD